MRTTGFFGFAVLLSVLSASSSDAQQTVLRSRYEVSCNTCSFSLEKVVTVGSSSDPVLMGGPAGFERDNKGRYYAISFDRRQIVVYNSDGSYLTAIGRKGGGPGEINSAFGIGQISVTKSDTIFAIDGVRAVVFSPSFAYVRTMNLPLQGVTRMSALSSGEIVGSASRPGRPAFFVVTTRDSSVRWLPDIAGSAFTPQWISTAFRMDSDQKSFWTVSDFRIEQRLIDGLPGRKIEFDQVPWLTPPVMGTMASARGVTTQMPRSTSDTYLMGVDSAGMIWIARSKLDPTKQGAASRIELGVEVVDSRTGALVLSRPLEKTFVFIGNGPLVYTGEPNADGVAILTVYRLRFQR